MDPFADLPSLRSTIRLGGKGTDDRTSWYDAKFNPYTPPGIDPVFAVTGGCNTVICRCVLDRDSSIDVLRWFSDEDKIKPDGEPLQLNSVEWSRASNGDPLVCVTGDISQIKVLNVRTGQLVATLSGHGYFVNDLAVSPIDPTILVSASEDYSLRIWSLDPRHRKQPTAAICFGQGHRAGVLKATFHRKGQYFLSSGRDNMINLWAVPPTLQENMGTDHPDLVHFPHFSTAEVHADSVDCVMFYGDLILSRGARDMKILLWRIDGFDADGAVPATPPVAPSRTVLANSKVRVPAQSGYGTRSAWGGRFQRLLQFDLPRSDICYMRFGLFHEIGQHPILVAGDVKSRLYLWDLQRLEAETGAGVARAEDAPKRVPRKGEPLRPKLGQKSRETRSASTASSSTTAAATAAVAAAAMPEGKHRGGGGGSGSGSANKSRGPGKPKNDAARGLGDAFRSLKPHHTVEVPKINFTVRQCVWSRGGQWCAVVGDWGMMALLSRWEGDGIPAARDAASSDAVT